MILLYLIFKIPRWCCWCHVLICNLPNIQRIVLFLAFIEYTCVISDKFLPNVFYAMNTLVLNEKQHVRVTSDVSTNVLSF